MLNRDVKGLDAKKHQIFLAYTKKSIHFVDFKESQYGGNSQLNEYCVIIFFELEQFKVTSACHVLTQDSGMKRLPEEEAQVNNQKKRKTTLSFALIPTSRLHEFGDLKINK